MDPRDNFDCNPSFVAEMVVICLQELGPLTVGVAGKLIQQRTGIPG